MKVKDVKDAFEDTPAVEPFAPIELPASPTEEVDIIIEEDAVVTEETPADPVDEFFVTEVPSLVEEILDADKENPVNEPFDSIEDIGTFVELPASPFEQAVIPTKEVAAPASSFDQAVIPTEEVSAPIEEIDTPSEEPIAPIQEPTAPIDNVAAPIGKSKF